MSNRRIYIFSNFFYKISCLGHVSQKNVKQKKLGYSIGKNISKNQKNRLFRLFQKSTQINFF